MCRDAIALEQREINRATVISAPSQSSVIASRVLFDLPKNILCYPNPTPVYENIISKCYNDTLAGVLFVGNVRSQII